VGRLHVSAEEAREGEEYLRRYLAEAEPRLRWLREESARTGGPTPDQLDLGRDSLVPLWTWAVNRFQARPADQPLEKVEHGRHRYFVPVGATLPMWYGRRGIQAPHGWSDETLELIDALVYYLAETILRAVPDARWEVWHADVKDHINENQPVLTGFTAPIDPLTTVIGLGGRVTRHLNPDAPNPYEIPAATPHDLRDRFDAAVGWR